MLVAPHQKGMPVYCKDNDYDRSQAAGRLIYMGKTSGTNSLKTYFRNGINFVSAHVSKTSAIPTEINRDCSEEREEEQAHVLVGINGTDFENSRSFRKPVLFDGVSPCLPKCTHIQTQSLLVIQLGFSGKLQELLLAHSKEVPRW